MRPLLPREKVIVWFLAVLVIGIGFYYLVYAPKSAEINAASQELKKAKDELTRLQAQAARREQIERRLKELQQQVKETEAKLPTSREIPTLLVQLEGLASQTGANLTLIRPGPAGGGGQGAPQPARPGAPAAPAPGAGLGLQQFALELTAEGTYDVVESFVRGIENFPRFIAMSDLKITPLPPRAGESGDRPRLSVGLTATTYFVPESGGAR
jgi:type IV pilus assembly protein PilO